MRDGGTEGRKVERTENELEIGLVALLRLPKEESQSCNKEGIDWSVRVPRRDRPGCSR